MNELEALTVVGARRGARWTEPDPDKPNELLGAHIRELRDRSGLSHADLAAAMASHGWSKETVTRVQGGRTLTPEELLSLSRIFDVTVDGLLTEALGETTPAPVQDSRAIAPAVTRFVADMPPFSAFEGQLGDIEELAGRVGVSRAQMCRELWAIAIPAYRAWLDQEGQS